jgi:hypothetical protein
MPGAALKLLVSVGVLCLSGLAQAGEYSFDCSRALPDYRDDDLILEQLKMV